MYRPGRLAQSKNSYRLVISIQLTNKMRLDQVSRGRDLSIVTGSRTEVTGLEVVADFDQVGVRVPKVNGADFAYSASAFHRTQFNGEPLCLQVVLVTEISMLVAVLVTVMNMNNG